MNTWKRISVILILGLSLVVSACGPGQIFSPTFTPTPTMTPTSTNTSIPTYTPTFTPTLTPTPTPIGYGSGEFLYEILTSDGNFKGLYSSERGLLISMAQLEEKVGTASSYSYLWPSPNGELAVLTLGQMPDHPSSSLDFSHYLVSIDLSTVMPIRYPGLNLDQWIWSSDSSRLIGTGGDGTGRPTEYCIADSTDGRIITCIPTNLYNSWGVYWSEDNSRVYWSNNGRLWVAGADGSMGHYVDLTFILDWFNLEGMSFSPDGTKVALIIRKGDPSKTLYLANSDFTNPVKPIAFSGNPYFLLTWSPDSRYVFWNLYSSLYLPQHMVEVSTGEEVSFPSPADAIFCGWSRDNKVFAYIESGALYIAATSDPSLRRQVSVAESDQIYFCTIWISK